MQGKKKSSRFASFCFRVFVCYINDRDDLSALKTM